MKKVLFVAGAVVVGGIVAKKVIDKKIEKYEQMVNSALENIVKMNEQVIK